MTRDEDSRLVTTREGYAQWAGHYDHHDNPMTAMVEHVLAVAPANISGTRVMELGCGTGRNASVLRALGAINYLGIDNSPEMLEVARKRGHNDPNVRFTEGDMRRDWWSHVGTFDVAVASLVFEHFRRVDEILAGIARVVAPGGLLWILEIHPALQHGGVGAHVEKQGETLVLPSFRHTAAEFVNSFTDSGWAPDITTEWYANEALTGRSAKLARYLGRPVLLEVRARRAPTRRRQ